jgi:predicted HNH restriction endonuclease
MAHDYVKEDFMKMENWNAMLKKVKDDSEEEKKSKGTGKFDVKKTTTGTEYTRKSSTFNNGTADKPSAKNEEVEELDELSKSTLGSYTKKASLNATITRKIAGDFENRANRAKSPGMKDANTELSSKYKQKSWKRRDGVEKAVDRLTKEEVEVIDEATAVHPKAIHVSDAGGGKYKVHAVGKDFSHGIKVGEHLNDTHLDDFSEMGGKVKMVKPPKKD